MSIDLDSITGLTGPTDVPPGRDPVAWYIETSGHAEAHRACFTLAHLISEPSDYWGAVRSAWERVEMPGAALDNWRRVWRGSGFMAPYRSQFVMDDEERAVMAALPDEVEVFRGFAHTQDGISWTTNRDTAEFFATRFGGGRVEPAMLLALVVRRGITMEEALEQVTTAVPRVAGAVVPKDRIVAYLNGRGEEEVIILDPVEATFVHEVER